MKVKRATYLEHRMIFAHPEWLYAILLLPVSWFLFKRRGKVGATTLSGIKTKIGSRIIMILPKLLLSLGFVALCLALARPQEIFYESDTTVKARDIVIAVDKSGSMSSTIRGPLPTSSVGETDLDRDWPGKPAPINAPTSSYQRDGYSRLEVAQAAVLDFVRNRYIVNAGDRIGVMVFDDNQLWSWPLTHDLKMIYRKVRFADEGTGGGTNFGNEPPGPIDRAIEHFGELGQAQSRVVIMVTDGENDLTEATKRRISDQITSYGIKFYVIGVGETLARQDTDITRLATSLGGHVFRAETAGDMQKIFTAIDQMERSDINSYGVQKRNELYVPFALAALLLLLLTCGMQAIILNE
ncbi:MAG: VWA domain-containing protein [Candidatus Obscuribacter sp.]|nr:VWA domain-containing protein [Candidatus Obscuribacter sp.]